MPGAARAQLSGAAAVPEPLLAPWDAASWGLSLAPQLEEHPLQPGQEPARFILGDRARGTVDRDVDVQGRGEVRTDRLVVKGDRLHYDQDTDVADAYGNVLIVNGGDTYAGPEAHLHVDATQGYMLTPKYRFNATGGSGSARRIDVLDPERSVVDHGTYTACQCEAHPAWYISASRFEMDNGSQTGVARNAVLFFQGVPLLAAPYMSFPLNDARRSGFLSPTFGFDSHNGADLAVPYYFNIAPNRDFTLTERLIERRGVQSTGDYRYLSSHYSGEARVEYLPNDRLTQTSRYAVFADHYQDFGSGFGGYLIYNRVSDNTYPEDLASSNTLVVNGTQVLYQQEAGLTYDHGPWAVLARVQHWQTLPPSTPPYEREPQLNVKYNRYDVGGFDYGAEADYSRFKITTADTVEGQRVYLDPYLSYAIVRPDYFITPKVQYHLASYSLVNTSPGQPSQLTSSIPTLSLDSGLQFERNVQLFGQDYIQTLEPRLYYVYTPFHDQSQIPLFDTAEADFGLAEIYTDNTYVGNDRVADANRLTAGVTTRFINPATGDERARFVVAQQYYFRDQTTTIAGQTPDQATHSDLLFGASVKLAADFASETAFQYNADRGQLVRSTAGFSWSPEDRKVLNFAYRYTRPSTTLNNQSINQLALSAQWLLTRRWYGVGRVDYDMDAHRVVDGLVGFQYDADCWTFGLALQRYANGVNTLGQPNTGTRVLAQLVLKGLSSRDNGFIQQIRASIPGYVPPPPPPPPQSRFTNYE